MVFHKIMGEQFSKEGRPLDKPEDFLTSFVENKEQSIGIM